ncbi:hypothetical protein U9M48_040695 [Paspalum notatum var. saurae]|uniref:RING-type domain-containing protein n=1 Tax=Paspalum notatum var. saurae TaxID=547442 RepID=A0AAQ3XDH7_PASNO
MHISSEDGRRLCIMRMSLANPSLVSDERVVNVWAEVRHEKHAIGTLSSKQPVVSVPSVVLGGEFVLRHDLPVPNAVWLNVRILGATTASSDDVEDEEEETVIVLGKDEEEDDDQEETTSDSVLGEEDVADETATIGVEYEPLSEEDVAERYDSDNESSTDADSVRPLVAALAGSAVVVPDGEFLGPARLAAAGNTAGIMRIAAAEATGDHEGKEILVLYRYTRFSRPRSGRRGVVEACRRTKLHRLRFAVPRAGDLASSLAWAGSSLGPLIYPGLFRRELQDLWTSLLAAPAIDTVMQQAWPAYYYHVAMELHLPEPVVMTDGRVGGQEECCICFESLLESGGAAAWPGCRHMFHGSCVEKTLGRSEMCPLCRHRLSDPLVQKIEHQDPSIHSRARDRVQ